MTKVIWGSDENKKSTPIIRGAKKCGNNEFVIPLMKIEVAGIQIDVTIISQFIRSLCGGADVVVGGVNSVKWSPESQRAEIDTHRIIGRTTRAWLEDSVIYAVILLNDRSKATEYANMLEKATDDIYVFVPYICRFPSDLDETVYVDQMLPIVCLNKIVFNQSVENEESSMVVTAEQLEPAVDKIMTPAVMRSIVVDNSVLNNESIILRGITPTEDGNALVVRIPELNNRRVFIGCVGYEVLYFDAQGRAVVATKSKLFNQHKAQASATQPYRLAYSEDKVTIWFVNGNDILNNAFPEKTFKPATLIEMFGGEAYLANCVNGQFRLPSCCEFKTEDVITVNGTRVSLIRIDASSGFAVFEPHGMILENLKEACKISEPFGDERSLIIVKRTDENRVEITVSQPMSAKTK